MNIRALIEQYRGRKFGELVLHDYKQLSQSVCIESLFGTVGLLPEEVQNETEIWIDEISIHGVNPSFWKQDCGETLAVITNLSKKYFEKHHINPTDEDLFNMFQITVLNFVGTCYKNEESKFFIQKAVGIGLLRRLFGE